VSRRTSLEAIVTKAIKNSGATKESVARAADITVAELDSYLSDEGSFPVSVLRRVGGFLHFEAPDVMEESYANH
jgi:hypothetical protein